MVIDDFKKNAGFTLIELIVGMAIVIVSATAVVVLLSSSFRISNKTTSISSVRESGNNAINFFQRTVEFANGFYGASNDRATYVTACSSTPTSYAYIKVRTASGNQEFSCVPNHFYYNSGTADVDLIDTSKVTVTTCQLTCAQVSGDVPPVIGVTIGLTFNNASNVAEKISSISFSTSAKMRNL